MLAFTAKRTIKQFIVVFPAFVITHHTTPENINNDAFTFDKIKNIEMPKEYQPL
jgi:hypothetical protein